jgi:DNA repair protein SbcD/Mre11
MVKFAHISDVHLGGWKQPPMQELNFSAFKQTIDICIKEKLDFVLIVGDLFDTAYPGIEVLKRTFSEFKRLNDARIPCFLVAGSHDYSVSGKTFLDVLEHAGFCKNIFDMEEKEGQIYLNPHQYSGVALYGYPGKKSGMEIEDLRRIKLHDSPGMYKVLALHTTIDKAKGTLPIDALEVDSLPSADYYALGHLHINFEYENFVYPGPIFPNNFAELEDLQRGSFHIVDTNMRTSTLVELSSKKVLSLRIEINDATIATEKILYEMNKHSLEDRIILLRIRGLLEHGKNSDINFQKIEEFALEKGAYFILKNTHDLKTKEVDLEVEVTNKENIEEEAIKIYSEENPSDLNEAIPSLIEALSIEKEEGEKTELFNSRLLESAKRILKF